MPTLPSPLVSTAWLASHLEDPTLRVLDATVLLEPPANGDGQWTAEPGVAAHDAAHVPGAQHADLVREFSVWEGRFRRPAAEQVVAAAERLGIGTGTHVVVYDRAGSWWATRLWWVLRSFGFDDVAVLDGGWARWVAEDRPTTAEPTLAPAPAKFDLRERPALVADRADVLAVVRDGGACLINALDEEDFYAQSTERYARPGRIPDSINVPASALLDPDTGLFRPLEELQERFATVRANPARKVLYCGGGIAATSGAFVLALLGEPDAAVYSGSMAEWSSDPELPMEVGSRPT